MTNPIRAMQAKFEAQFGAAPVAVVRAPGRVNLIGEHTDYNEGFVLPAAIGFSCCTAIAPRPDRRLVITSENLGETVEASLDGAALRPAGAWQDYPLGVAKALEEDGYRLRGASLYIQSDVPLGSGLSSSAALEVSAGYALLTIAGYTPDRVRLARLCQRAENEFVGARTGIMDPFISCHGRAHHGLLLDCRSLEFHYLPLPDSVQLVICNTMVKHEISAGEYNTRRAECEEGVRRLRKSLPGIRALRDVPVEELERHRGRLGETLYKRCRHVITENDRTLKAASVLKSGDAPTFGQLISASHRSLRDDYEVSCEELDLMVDLALRQRGVYGSRMTGGGFGGCTVSLVEAATAAEFQQRVAVGYFAATGRRPDIYVCEASAGVEAVSAETGEPDLEAGGVIEVRPTPATS